MREVLEASWSLLPPDGQRAFAQLAVFSGPFELAAAEYVLQLDGRPTIDALQMLVQASLLNVTEGDGGLRYSMFDIVGAFAVEKSRSEPAQEAATLRRFVRWYLDQDPLDDLTAMLDRTRPRLARLARDERQYFAIYHRALESETPDHVTAARALFRVYPLVSLRAAEPLHLSYYEQLAKAWPEAPTDGSERRWRLADAVLRLTRVVLNARGGNWTERLGQVESLADLALCQTSTAFHAVVLWYEAQCADALGETQRSIDRAKAAIDVGLGGDDAAVGVAGYAYLILSRAQMDQNRLEEGRRSAERALTIARERDDLYLLSRAASGLAAALRGLRRDGESHEMLRASVDAAEACRAVMPGAAAKTHLGVTEQARGRLAAAEQHLSLARARFAEIGFDYNTLIAQTYLGLVQHERQDMASARLSYQVAGELMADATWPGQLCRCLLAIVDASTGQKAKVGRGVIDDATRWLAEHGAPKLAELLVPWARLVFDGGEAAEARVLELAERRTEVRPDSVIETMMRLMRTDHRRATRDPLALLVTFDQGWCRPPGGAWVDFRRRRVQRSLLRQLVDARLNDPGAALGVQAMLDGTWSDERGVPEASLRNRLHVAMHQLRGEGFGEVIEHDGEGWLLRADLPVVYVTHAVEE
ncbi:MAG: tetratricopeptide repeat protein [Myxococcales bacterium]|nr:tetratricopeptide repeat protein [Myxococcales bacterium]